VKQDPQPHSDDGERGSGWVMVVNPRVQIQAADFHWYHCQVEHNTGAKIG